MKKIRLSYVIDKVDFRFFDPREMKSLVLKSHHMAFSRTTADLIISSSNTDHKLQLARSWEKRVLVEMHQNSN